MRFQKTYRNMKVVNLDDHNRSTLGVRHAISEKLFSDLGKALVENPRLTVNEVIDSTHEFTFEQNAAVIPRISELLPNAVNPEHTYNKTGNAQRQPSCVHHRLYWTPPPSERGLQQDCIDVSALMPDSSIPIHRWLSQPQYRDTTCDRRSVYEFFYCRECGGREVTSSFESLDRMAPKV